MMHVFGCSLYDLTALVDDVCIALSLTASCDSKQIITVDEGDGTNYITSEAIWM